MRGIQPRSMRGLVLFTGGLRQHGPRPGAERVNKRSLARRKSQKVREFREMNDISIKEWLTRFDQEVTTLKRIYNVTDDLTRDEII